jgi:hypothetical protein
MTTGFVTVGGTVTTGIVGGGAATGLGVGVTGIVGTGVAELTPRLLISVEPKGIPVRGWPPGVLGEVGAEEAAKLFEPEPHIPDIPAVSIAPEAEVIDDPDADAPPVAGIEFATDIPAPS